MKNLKFIIAALAATVSVSASAGTGSGKIKSLIVTVGAVIFSMENPSNSPACSAAGEYAISGNTQEGKNTLAFILAAASQGRPITVFGTGNCSVTGDRETVLYVFTSY